MLWSSTQPARDLRRLIELEGQRYVERHLNVHRPRAFTFSGASVMLYGMRVVMILFQCLMGSARASRLVLASLLRVVPSQKATAAAVKPDSWPTM